MSIPKENALVFSQQLANLIKVGISLTKALQALETQEQNKEFKAIIKQVYLDVEGGSIFSEALAKYPQVFSRFYVNMIYAGEQGAGFALVLDYISSYLEKELYLKTKIKSVYMYPLVVGVLCFIIVAFLVMVVAPVFVKVYQQLGVALPMPTRIVLGLSQVIQQYWWLIAAFFGATYFGLRYLKKQVLGQKILGWLQFHLPVFGEFNRQIAVANFVRTLATMLVCHVHLNKAFTIMQKIVKSRPILKVLDDCIRTVQGGGRLSDVLAKSRIFPPVLAQITYAGEESGALGKLLDKYAQSLDQDVEYKAKKVIILIEPTLTILLAGIVGFIALAIYLPMFDLIKLVS
ncbi:type II secretion system F family protein [bacterium]|mgnify:CR=1 FL=1|nr:type II secretion system F family protein [bacterium]MBT3581618.1 type II secretion system F family protein [bacterium]MBT4552017.1 type II secretion system F family protein [bacterium]